MGHHHELPLIWVMELRPNHWSTTMRSHLEARGITHWHRPIILNQSSIIYHAHNSHVNLYNQIHIHIPCWIHSNSSFPIHEYRISPHTNTMPFWYQPFHWNHMSRFIQVHHSQSMNHITHANSFISYFINAYQDIHISQNSIHPK